MFRNLCLALLLSLLLGTIFWHVRAAGREQEVVWDRIMFYHCLLAIVPVPLYLIQMNDGKLLILIFFSFTFVPTRSPLRLAGLFWHSDWLSVGARKRFLSETS